MLLELQELNKKLDLLEAGNTKLQKKLLMLIWSVVNFYYTRMSVLIELNLAQISVIKLTKDQNHIECRFLIIYSIGFVIYASKQNLQLLNKVIKNRIRIVGGSKHINCKANVFECFMTEYLQIMKFDYKIEYTQQLKLLNIFFKVKFSIFFWQLNCSKKLLLIIFKKAFF
jgi:hypothetical protein